MTFHGPTQWHPILNGDQLTRARCHPSRYEQVKEHNIEANIMNEGEFNATYSSALIIRVTHTMIPGLITS
jgi:hypothetical protein